MAFVFLCLGHQLQPCICKFRFFLADGKFLLSYIFIIRSSADGHQGWFHSPALWIEQQRLKVTKCLCVSMWRPSVFYSLLRGDIDFTRKEYSPNQCPNLKVFYHSHKVTWTVIVPPPEKPKEVYSSYKLSHTSEQRQKCIESMALRLEHILPSPQNVAHSVCPFRVRGLVSWCTGLGPLHHEQGATHRNHVIVIDKGKKHYAWTIKWNRDRYRYINNLKTVHE